MKKKGITPEDLQVNPEFSGKEKGMASSYNEGGKAGTLITEEVTCKITLTGCDSELCPDKPSVDICPVSEKYPCVQSEECASEGGDPCQITDLDGCKTTLEGVCVTTVK